MHQDCADSSQWSSKLGVLPLTAEYLESCRLNSFTVDRDTSKEYYVKWYIIFYHCNYRFMSGSIYDRFILNLIFCTTLGWIRYNQNLVYFGLISIFIFLTCRVMGWDRFRSPVSLKWKQVLLPKSSLPPDHMTWNYWYNFWKFQ
jgi:hypothetical protein